MLKKLILSGIITCGAFAADDFGSMLTKLKQYSKTIKHKKVNIDKLQQQLKLLEKQQQQQQIKIKVAKLKYDYIKKYKDFFRVIRGYYRLQLINFNKTAYVEIKNKVVIGNKKSYEVEENKLNSIFIQLKNQYKERVRIENNIRGINKILNNNDLILVNKDSYDSLIQTYNQMKQNSLMQLLQQNNSNNPSMEGVVVYPQNENNVINTNINQITPTIYLSVGDYYKKLKVIKEVGNNLEVEFKGGRL